MIVVKDLRVNIGGKEILHGLDFAIPRGKVTVILGPNGCGKSTTLKTMCRLLPYGGCVEFMGREVKRIDGREFAKEVAILAQSPKAPEDLTVLDLVKMGRFPHRNLWGGGSSEDSAAVAWALERTGLTDYRERILNALSGGERQRAWIAMALAQKPKVLFLDEPTSYLDICHQLEVLNLVRELNRQLGLTVVVVLHDITQTLSVGDNFLVIKDGCLVAAGGGHIVNKDLLLNVFGVEAEEFCCADGQRAIVPKRKAQFAFGDRVEG